jgi:hypothetical protein
MTEPFGEPFNLGPTVNSSTLDHSPALSADGRTLVFGSDRPGGQGELDLWMARIEQPGSPGTQKVSGTGAEVPIAPAAPRIDARAEPPAGAVLWMTFERSTVSQSDGNVSVKDLSGAGNHGIGEGVAYTPHGVLGGGLAIQGGSLRLPTTLLNKRTEYTITAWVNKASRAESLILYREYGVTGPVLYQVDFVDHQGRMRAKCWNRHHRAKPNYWVHVDSEATVSAAQWHFVAIRVTDAASGEGTLAIRIDDESFTHDFQMFELNATGHGSLGAGNGVLDEVAIFDRALSDQEIDAMYEAGGGSPTN